MKPRRHFTKEFKQEAVTLSFQEGVTVAKVAENLGLTASMLSRWRKEFKKEGLHAFPGQGKQTPEQAELTTLKKKLRRAEAERDILKKAMGIFASE